MKEKIKIKVHIPGGILSPGDLRKIVNAANYFGTDHIHLGSRQDILLEVDEMYRDDIGARFQSLQYPYEFGESRYQNIVTSFPASSIQSATSWMTEGIYHQLLSSFDYLPEIKINIADPLQTMTPLFMGQLNYIASPHYNYWYLYVRLKDEARQSKELWPVLVDGVEMAALSKVMEQILKAQPEISFADFEKEVYNRGTWNFRVNDAPLESVKFHLPHYEGFHFQEEDREWLGIFNTNNSYAVNFLEDLCILCGLTSNSRICLTNNKSLLIKNIASKDVYSWESLLGKHKINTGHSSLDLNWQLPDLDREAYKLKDFIVKNFLKQEVRTDGITFGISTEPADFVSSIMIERRWVFKIGKYRFMRFFDIRYKSNFDLNSDEIIFYAGYVKMRDLPAVLNYLTEQFYKGLGGVNPEEKSSVGIARTEDEAKNGKIVYQCKKCLSIYDPQFGDENAGVAPGVLFNELPSDYLCGVCEESRNSFIPVNMEKLTA
jgi:rubredoxin